MGIETLPIYEKLNSFLDSCSESPCDDVPRLVMADWLDDNMRPEWVGWPEFIRLGCSPTRDHPDTEAKLQKMLDVSPVPNKILPKGGGWLIPNLVGSAWLGWWFYVREWIRGLPWELSIGSMEENWDNACKLLHQRRYFGSLHCEGYVTTPWKKVMEKLRGNLPPTVTVLDYSGMAATGIKWLRKDSPYIRKLHLPKRVFHSERPWNGVLVRRVLDWYPNLVELVVPELYKEEIWPCVSGITVSTYAL